MQILFLHISDLHIKNEDGCNVFQIKKIADSVNQFSSVEAIIIIVTGDIAYSGEPNQYTAASYCVGNLISAIRRRRGPKFPIKVVCVPGNHDIYHDGHELSISDLQEIRKKNIYEAHLQTELNKQQYFFEFATISKCFTEDRAFCRKIISINGFKLEINLINSGIFSTPKGEDKGLHYIPLQCINLINTPSGADFALSLMHHSPDWYNDSQKNLLESAIYKKSSLVFYGHEHYVIKKEIKLEGNIPAIIHAGGCLCVNDNWSMSTYHIGILDTDTFMYNHAKYIWNEQQRQYEAKETSRSYLVRKPSIEKQLEVQPAYALFLHADKKHNISEKFLDYYVFPRIQAEEQNGEIEKEFTECDDFVLELLLKKKIIVTGGDDAGKTTFLKYIFIELSREYKLIFCDIDDIRGKKVDRIIRNCFNEIYGENESDYQRFLQAPKEKRILVIDDIDKVNPKHFDNFISQLADTFEYFIFSSGQTLDFNLLDRIKTLLKAKNSIYRYRLSPFYSDKRRELVEKIVSLKIYNHENLDKTVDLLVESIKSQRRFLSLDPYFIIKYVEYYCNNIGEASSNDGSVFSKIFEASLINAVSKYQTPKLSVDKIFVLLSRVAHYIHFNQAYPISAKEIFSVIDIYCRDYGTKIDSVHIINIMVDSKILAQDETTEGYKFTNKNYLAFFVARQVNKEYNSTGNSEDLKKILTCACFGINSDILLFISYITDNTRILHLMLEMMEKFTKGWGEFSFGDALPEHLKGERSHIVSLPPEDALKKKNAEEVMTEKAMHNELQTIELYDYSEEEADRFVNQIMRACSLLIVMAKCLPAFEHNMEKNEKDAFVDAIYTLPNKIFQQWAMEADKQIDDIIKFFKEQSQDYYLHQTCPTDDDIIRELQWVSMSFLLDLYNASAFYATKDNSIEYLNTFNYKSRDTYALEHLMILEKQASPVKFAETAVGLIDKKKGHIFSTLLSRIVSHALVYMKKIDYRSGDQLKTKFFPTKEIQKKLMANKMKNQRKKQ